VRVLLLSAGLVFLAMTAMVTYVRRVETAEVVAILLFIPIFIALIFWDWIGGLTVAALATCAYVALRLDAIHAVGLGQFRGVIVSRALAFLAFGIVGGLANRQFRSSLVKLDLYDQIDDASGLYNARFFLEATDLELSRAHRYQTLFSVSLVDIPTAAVATLSRRARSRKLREIGRALQASVRTVDRAIHASDGRNHRFAVVLPETGEEGVRIFTERLAERLSAMAGIDAVATVSVTCPGDEDSLRRLRDEFAQIDRREHPGRPRLIGVSSAA
jgi:GGDEF domain-containing protein